MISDVTAVTAINRGGHGKIFARNDLLLSRHLKGQHPSPAGRPNESTNYARCKLQIGDFELGHYIGHVLLEC